MTRADGTRYQGAEYLPYGSTRGSADISMTDYKFTDQEHDQSTGLYNYDARLYDPVIGRFIAADSEVPEWNNPQALNRYAYCLNNPLVYLDPNGHRIMDAFRWMFSPFFKNIENRFDSFMGKASDLAYTAYTTPIYHYPDAKMWAISVNMGSGISAVGQGELVLNSESGQASLFGAYGWNAGIVSWSASIKKGIINDLENNSDYNKYFGSAAAGWSPIRYWSIGLEGFWSTNSWDPRDLDANGPYGWDTWLSFGALPTLTIGSTYYSDIVTIDDLGYYGDPVGWLFNSFDDMSLQDYVNYFGSWDTGSYDGAEFYLDDSNWADF